MRRIGQIPPAIIDMMSLNVDLFTRTCFLYGCLDAHCCVGNVVDSATDSASLYCVYCNKYV